MIANRYLLSLLLVLALAATCAAATSPFEIDTKELRDAPVLKTPAKSRPAGHHRPAGKRRHRRAQKAGTFPVRVTVKTVPDSDPCAILSGLLAAIGIDSERNQHLTIDAGGTERLTVPVDLRFSARGERYAASCSTDPATLTLLRLLELKGYRTVILTPDDDLWSIAIDLLGRLDIPHRYGCFTLAAAPHGRHVTVRGVMLEISGKSGHRRLLVTDQAQAPREGRLVGPREAAGERKDLGRGSQRPERRR